MLLSPFPSRTKLPSPVFVFGTAITFRLLEEEGRYLDFFPWISPLLLVSAGKISVVTFVLFELIFTVSSL